MVILNNHFFRMKYIMNKKDDNVYCFESINNIVIRKVSAGYFDGYSLSGNGDLYMYSSSYNFGLSGGKKQIGHKKFFLILKNLKIINHNILKWQQQMEKTMSGEIHFILVLLM